MLRSSRNEVVVEGYQVGMWMKRTAERLDREKKEQEEKKREKERSCREENERKEKEIRCKQMEAKKRRQDRFEKNFEEFSKELKILQRKYLGEKKSVEKNESLEKEVEVNENESNAKVGEAKESVVKAMIMDTCFDSNHLPNCVNSIEEQVADHITKEAYETTNVFGKLLPGEECNASNKGELQVENEGMKSEWPTLKSENESSNTLGKSLYSMILIPSPQWFYGFNSLNSYKLFLWSNNSSLEHKEKKVNEEEFPQEMAYFQEKRRQDNYALESKGKEEQASHSNELANFSNVEVTCGEFHRFIFDPGGIGSRNSRSNSLEEGGNDVNLGLPPLTKEEQNWELWKFIANDLSGLF